MEEIELRDGRGGVRIPALGKHLGAPPKPEHLKTKKVAFSLHREDEALIQALMAITGYADSKVGVVRVALRNEAARLGIDSREWLGE